MKILITNHHIKNFAGSEINALQLCGALRKFGFETDVATFFYGSPMKEIYESNRITVKNLFNEQLEIGSYDLFWTHHFPTTNQILLNEKLRKAKIIFSSLGSFAPLESPPIYHNQLNCVLANSQANSEILLNEGLNKNKIYYFPNFAPSEYFREKKLTRKRLSRIAIISNHPPKELLHFTEIATLSGYNIDLIGLQNEPIFVDKDFLQNYDLIITIGKTIQYCFALRIPVYCYDHFGGPGYINKNNIKFSEKYVFSGRGLKRKLSGPELFQEITEQYFPSLNNLDFLFDYSLDHFNLDRNLSKLLEYLSSTKPIDAVTLRENHKALKRHHAVFISNAKYQEEAEKLDELLKNKNQIFEKLHEKYDNQNKELHRINSELLSLISTNENLQKTISTYKNTNESLQKAISIYKNKNEILKQEILYFALSKSWILSRPFRKLMRKFHEIMMRTKSLFKH